MKFATRATIIALMQNGDTRIIETDIYKDVQEKYEAETNGYYYDEQYFAFDKKIKKIEDILSNGEWIEL